VINLDRSTDRWQRIHTQLNDEGIEHVRLRAVDGDEVKLRSSLGEEFYGRDIRSGKKKLRLGESYTIFCPNVSFRYDYRLNTSYGRYDGITSGEIGCYCSHLEAMVDIARHQYHTAIVLEDDADIKPGLKQKLQRLSRVKLKPTKWDLIYLQAIYSDMDHPFRRRFPIWFGEVSKLRLMGYGTYALMLNHHGAKKILNDLMTYGTHEVAIDMLLINMIQHKSINAYKANRVNIGHFIDPMLNFHQTSNIFNMGRTAAHFNPYNGLYDPRLDYVVR